MPTKGTLQRKETIERIFGTAKEHHGMRYTTRIGKEKMAMKVGMTFTCLNIKKLVNILDMREKNKPSKYYFSKNILNFA